MKFLNIQFKIKIKYYNLLLILFSCVFRADSQYLLCEKIRNIDIYI